jgi:hypothetical protein
MGDGVDVLGFKLDFHGRNYIMRWRGFPTIHHYYLGSKPSENRIAEGEEYRNQYGFGEERGV